MAKTLTFYYSPDCGHCHDLEPEIRQAANRHGYSFKKVNVDECQTDRCDRMGFVPTVYVGRKELSVPELEALIGDA